MGINLIKKNHIQMFVSNTFVSLIVSYLTLPAYNHFGCISFIFLFIIPSIFSLFYLYRNLPETKDREVSFFLLKISIRVLTSSLPLQKK